MLPLSQSLGTGPSASPSGYCCRLCPTRGRYPGKFSFYRTPGGKWAQKTCAGCPHQRYATGVPRKAQKRDLVGIVERSSGVPGSVFGENSFYRETWGMEAPHCHWRSNIGPCLLATVIRGQIVNPCAPNYHKRTGSPISLEVRLWTILASHYH